MTIDTVSIANRCITLGVMETTFANLIRDRIATAYGGKQVEFARATGFKPQTVNTWLQGRVTLPQIDARRRLAKELGISHIDLLVAMGELEPSEVTAAGVVGVVEEDADSPRNYVHSVVDRYDWDDHQANVVAGLINAFRSPGDDVRHRPE